VTDHVGALSILLDTAFRSPLYCGGLTPTKLLRAALLAGACCVVLATRVFVAFDPIRIKAVEAPVTANGGSVRVRMSDQKVSALRLPFAVIARVRNDSPALHHFLISIDNNTVCDPTVAAHVTRRVDCALKQDWDPAREHAVVIESPATSWRLEYLELATHHGSSTGGLTLYVLPAASKRYTSPTVVWLFVVWLAVTGVLLLPSPDPGSLSMRFFSRSLTSVVIALFGLVVISPIVSPYVIVLSAWTFAGWLFLSLVPRFSSTIIAAWSWRIAAWSWRVFDEVWRVCRSIDDCRLVWLLSVSMCGVGLIYGSHAVGAADTYGYVSEADLWLRGNLRNRSGLRQTSAVAAARVDIHTARLQATPGRRPSDRSDLFARLTNDSGRRQTAGRSGRDVLCRSAVWWAVGPCDLRSRVPPRFRMGRLDRRVARRDQPGCVGLCVDHNVRRTGCGGLGRSFIICCSEQP
jgi:hypothetical protein